MPDEIRKDSPLEKHIQTILLSLIITAIVGGWSKMSGMSDTLIRIEERSSANQQKLDGMKLTIDNLSAEVITIKERLIKAENRIK